MPHKRRYDAIEHVDLTGDDTPPFRAQRARHHGMDQPFQDNGVGDDNDDEANTAGDIVVQSQNDDDDAATLTYQLYGVLDIKIVGVQYYTGYASIGE